MKKVLFVCLGNICRSPMAEAVFRKMILEHDLEENMQVGSRGTSSWEKGKTPHEGTKNVLAQHQIDFENIVSEELTAADFEEYDLLIGMDRQNVRDMKARAPKGTEEKIKLFLSILPTSDYQEVPDPYYTGDFDLTYQLISRGSQAWLNQLNK